MNKPSESILKDGVTLIVPIFNEADGIGEFLRILRRGVDALPFPCETLLIDDGSTDTTPARLAEETFRVIRHECNRGYGAAIKTGIKHSAHEALVILDADGTYAPEDLAAILQPLDHCDMVVGARTGAEAQIPLTRRPVKWVIRKFAEWMVRRTIPDLNSGLRAFRKSAVQKILPLLPDGFSLTTTITVAFMTGGKEVRYLPIQYRKRAGASKFHPIADTWNMILLILRTVVLIRPLNVFLPLSLVLAALALLVGVGSLAMGKLMDTTFIVLMMASIQMFVLGLIADLIVRLNLWTQ